MSACKWVLEVIAGKTERGKAAIKALGYKGTSMLKLVIWNIWLLSLPLCRNTTAFLKSQRLEGDCVICIHWGTKEFS